MNDLEKAVLHKYRRDGFKVISSGWPDFLLIKEVDGKEVILAAEVKSVNDQIRPNQKVVLSVLNKLMPIMVVKEGCGYGKSVEVKRKEFRPQLLPSDDWDLQIRDMEFFKRVGIW